MRDYQVEVLNKCEGRPWNANHPNAGTFYLLAKDVPHDLLNRALAQMQDVRLENLNHDRETVHDLTAYYLATVRNMCRDNGVETTIKWGKP